MDFPIDVFISRKSEDKSFAQEIYFYLKKKNLNVFESDESLPEFGNSDYQQAINNALEEAQHLIVVSSSLENISSKWVEYEWQVFLNEKLSGRKKGNIIIVVIDKLKPKDLPIGLRKHEVISYSTENLEKIFSYVNTKKDNPSGTPAEIKLENFTDIKSDLKKAKDYYKRWNIVEAFKYFKRVEDYDSEALFYLGEYYYWGNEPVLKDYKIAKRYYEKAVKNDYLFGYYGLARINQNKYTFILSNHFDKKAVKFINQKAIEGDYMACYLLGISYAFGYGVKIDYERSIFWIKASANEKFYLAIKCLFDINQSNNKKIRNTIRGNDDVMKIVENSKFIKLSNSTPQRFAVLEDEFKKSQEENYLLIFLWVTLRIILAAFFLSLLVKGIGKGIEYLKTFF